MYIPSLNQMDEQEEILAFMKRFSFATIITMQDDKPVATHLPFLAESVDGKIILKSHFAKANPQWKEIASQKNLVIFSEPHAYISPTNYEKIQNVPTWNYISVHAYGNGKILAEPSEVMMLLEHTILNYEVSYKSQWDQLSEKYKEGMAKGIVAFEIEVSDLQAKKKLSQNKSQAEKEKIINALQSSMDSNERFIAEYMEQSKKDSPNS
jgi:transcriptional regulator